MIKGKRQCLCDYGIVLELGGSDRVWRAQDESENGQEEGAKGLK